MFVVSPLSSLVNNRYVLTSFPRFEIDRFLTTGCCLVIQSELSVQLSEVELPPCAATALLSPAERGRGQLIHFLDFAA